MSETLNILPPNTTELESALVNSFLDELSQKMNIINILFDPNECPLEFLAYLAQFLSVDFEQYNNVTEAKKRSLIKDSINTHRKKGTLAVIKNALSKLDFNTDLKEWYEYEKSVPHTFKIDIMMNLLTNPKADLEHLQKTVNKHKNVQSSYVVNLVNQSDDSIYSGGATCIRHKTVLKDFNQ